jgi:hypothetical protein
MAGFSFDTRFMPPGLGVLSAAYELLWRVNLRQGHSWVYLLRPCPIVARVRWDGTCPIGFEFGYPTRVSQNAEDAINSVPDWSRRLAIAYHP